MVHIYTTSILSQYMKLIRKSTARTFKASSFSNAFRKRASGCKYNANLVD